MSLLSFFRNGKLKPNWEYHVKGIIWRVLFSGNDRIVGEDRDQQSKSVSFFCLNARSGEVLWEGLRLDEHWWVAIELIRDGVLFITEFVRPDLPELGKIYAVDLETGKVLWTNSELKMLFVAGSRVYASRELFERRVYYALDLRTGEHVGELGGDAEQIYLLKEEGGSTSEEGLLFPEVLTEQSHDHALVHSIVSLRCKEGNIKGPVEFIHFGKYILVSFHQLILSASGFIDTRAKTQDGMVNNQFLIVDADSRKILFQETLNLKSPNPVPDSFFVKDDLVYFIREKQHLVAIRLRT